MPYQIRQWEDISNDYHQETIVLGNGASIAVDRSFNYPSLLEHARDNGLMTNDVAKLFEFFDTEDFELVLRLVWHATTVNRSLEIPDERTRSAYRHVRDCLIQAVRDIHPDYSEVDNYLPRIREYLKGFDTVFSLNYDLIVYWAMTYVLDRRDGHAFKDCFKRGEFVDDWQTYRELYDERERSNTLVFYPHGSLALCRNMVDREFKIQSREGDRLLETVLSAWRDGSRIPLFVSEGTKEQKITSIQKSYYLSTVFREVLTSRRTSLTIYGWGLGEHDRHLLQQMRNTGIQQVAVSVYGNDQNYCRQAEHVIHQDLGRNISVDFFDSQSPGCWINTQAADPFDF